MSVRRSYQGAEAARSSHSTPPSGAVGELKTLQGIADPLVDEFRAKLASMGNKRGEFNFFEFHQVESDYLASATTFRVGNDLTWVVVAIAPKDDFLSGLWRSQAQALVGALVALGIAVILAVLMARRVSGPVLDLIGFMRRVGSGDLDAKADFGGSLEFQQLTEALNRMSGRLA